jgi:hypothetical protein
MNLDFQDGCVPAPGCPKFGCFSSSKSQCFLVAVGSRTRSPSPLAFPRVGAAARAAGGMPEYSEYPHQVPQAAGRSKNKKNPGVPPGPKAGYRMGTGYAGRGYPLGHTDPSPAVCIAQGGEDGAALGGAPRPSAVRPRARQRRRIDAHPDHRRRLPRQVGRSVRSARPMSAAGVGKCRRRCPQEVHAAARCCRPWPRRRNGRAARRRRGRIHRERTRVRRAVPRRAADCRQPQR